MLPHQGSFVNTKLSSGKTPLQRTVNQLRGELSPNNAEILNILLQYKSKVVEAAGTQKRTALHRAVIAGAAEAAEILLRYSASATLKDGDSNDVVALAIKHAKTSPR